MKILNILTLGSVGGAENFVLSLCRVYDKRRFEVKVAVLLSGGEVSNQIAREGHEVVELEMRNGFDILRAFKLIPLIREQNIDIVNIHSPNPLGRLCSVLSFAPVIIQSDHGPTMNSAKKRRSRVITSNRLLMPFVDHFIAISKGMAQTLMLRERVPRDKITLIYNGIDVDRISKATGMKEKLLKELKLDNKRPILGTVGRLSGEKQMPLLLQSLSLLKAWNQEFICLVVGDGPDRGYLQEYSSLLHLQNNIRFLGERGDVPALLELMDVFVFSSGGEAFSIALLEAMAKSLPIVAFDVEGVNEAVLSEKTGYLVPFADIELFSKRISHLLENPRLAMRMGEEGFSRVRSEFDLSRNVRKLENLYDQLHERKSISSL